MVQKIDNRINLSIYFFLAIISFSINYYVGSSGVYPVDTFIHYDNGYRILLGEHPIKDYWIVHGFLIDYIQAIFFKIFGYNWYAYIIHSSFFNSIIVLFSYYIFKILKIDLFLNISLCISIAILAYPVFCFVYPGYRFRLSRTGFAYPGSSLSLSRFSFG